MVDMRMGAGEPRHTIAMVPAAPSSAPREVRVTYADAAALVADAARAGDPRSWLRPAERERHDRFRHQADRDLFLAGRILARTLVGRALGCDPAAWRWREGPHGRPEIDEPGVSWRFNLSHSAGLIVCVLADRREVGVDVEDRQRAPVAPGFVRRYCSTAEADDVDAQPDATRYDRFLAYWTLKEAYLKALGLGISVHLADITFSLDGADRATVAFSGALAGSDPRWHLELAHPTPRHLLAVAASTADGAAIRVTWEKHV